MSEQPGFMAAGTISSASGGVVIELTSGKLTVKEPAGIVVIGDLQNGATVTQSDPEPAGEPLRLGNVILYGYLADAVRSVQSILAAHDIELKAVKSAPEPFCAEKNPSLADQILINAAAIGSATVDASISIKTASLEDGSKVMAGLIGELREPMERHLESTIRRVIREELKPGGMLHSR